MELNFNSFNKFVRTCINIEETSTKTQQLTKSEQIIDIFKKLSQDNVNFSEFEAAKIFRNIEILDSQKKFDGQQMLEIIEFASRIFQKVHGSGFKNSIFKFINSHKYCIGSNPLRTLASALRIDDDETVQSCLSYLNTGAYSYFKLEKSILVIEIRRLHNDYTTIVLSHMFDGKIHINLNPSALTLPSQIKKAVENYGKLIRSMDLRTMGNAICNDLVETILESCPNLQSIYIKSDKISGESLKAISRLENLLTLHLSECDNLIELPGKLPNSLQNLEIEKCNNLYALSHKLPDGLQSLMVGSCLYFRALPEKLPDSLNKLVLSKCISLTALPKKLPDNLKHLALPDCSGLAELPEKLPDGLIFLCLSNCNGLTAFPKKLPCSLLRLELSNLFNFTELQNLPKGLEFLDLSYCSGLSELPILSNLVNLQMLDLTQCINLNGFPQLSKKIEKIENLYVKSESFNKIKFFDFITTISSSDFLSFRKLLTIFFDSEYLKVMQWVLDEFEAEAQEITKPKLEMMLMILGFMQEGTLSSEEFQKNELLIQWLLDIENPHLRHQLAVIWISFYLPKNEIARNRWQESNTDLHKNPNILEIIIKNADPFFLSSLYFKDSIEDESTLFQLWAREPKYAEAFKALLSIIPEGSLLLGISDERASLFLLAVKNHIDLDLLKLLIQKSLPIIKDSANEWCHYFVFHQLPENIIQLIDLFPSECFLRTNRIGKTPLSAALINKKINVDALRAIIKKGGAYPLQVKELSYKTPLQIVASIPEYGQLFIEMIDIAYPSSLWEKTYNIESAMNLAMQYQANLEVLISIFKIAAREETEIDNYKNAAITVIKYQSPENLETLIPLFPKGCFCGKTSMGKTLLQIAYNNNKENSVLKAIAKYGDEVAINAQDDKGKTLFDYAKEKMDFALMTSLGGVAGLKKTLPQLEALVLKENQAKDLLECAIEYLDPYIFSIAKKALKLEYYDIVIEGPKKQINVSKDCLEGALSKVRKEITSSREVTNEFLDLLKDINNYTYYVSGQQKLTLLYFFMRSEGIIPSKGINLLLEAGADIYQETHKNGWTPLSWIMETPSKMTEFLPSIKHLQELDTPCELPGSKLTSAIIKGNVEDFEKALNMMLKGKKSTLKDALVKEQKMGVENHLHIAAKHNRAEFIQILIKAGLNPNFKNEDGWTPLKIAAVRGNKDVITVLVNLNGIKEADRNEALKFKDGWRVCLKEAANKINGLLEKNENIDPDKQLMEIILLRRELECMAKHNDSVDDVTQVFQLIEKVPSLQDLVHAALIQNTIPTKFIEILKLYGATLDDKNAKGKTAIYRALESGNSQKLGQLLELGASLGYGEEQFRILFSQMTQQEISHEYLACIQSLVAWGFDPNAPDSKGETLAHLIGMFGKLFTDDRQEKVTSILIGLVQSDLLENLQWNLPDSKGKTGLDYATESCNKLLIAAISRNRSESKASK